MGTKTAAAPVLSLAQLIDMRLEIDRQIEALETSKKALAEKIVAAMNQDGVTKAYGLRDEGYQKIKSIKADYRPGAIDFIKAEKIDLLFRPEPKITRSKVLGYHKDCSITEAQFLKLQSFAGEPYDEFTLRSIIKGKT